MPIQLLVVVYIFLIIYAIERAVFAFNVPDKIKPTKNAWVTFIPFFTYIALFFISVIEFSIVIRPLSFIVSALGIIILFLGVYLRYQAIKAFNINKQKWISHIDTEHIDTIVKSGAYSFLRHPYYSSVILELCGIALLLNTYRAIIFIFLIQVPLLWKRISMEEAELVKRFGDKYSSYKKQVAVIFPLRIKEK